MHTIFVSSTGAGSGHSLTAWYLMDLFHAQGMNTVFFKPFVTRPTVGNDQTMDFDALLIKEYYQLPEAVKTMCPVVPDELPGDEVTREEDLHRITNAFHLLAEGKDGIIIMGSDQIFYEADSPYIADTSLAAGFDASVVLVDRFKSESMTIYSLLAIESLLKERLKLIIINRIPPEDLDAVQGKLEPLFMKRGLPPVFFLPEDRILGSFTVRQIADIIQGLVLAGNDRLNNLVDGTSISSSHLKGSLNIFRRIYNKIILLGIDPGYSSTPQSASTVTGIILTGGRKPAPVVVNTCEDLRIPLIVSPADTFDTMEKIQKQKHHITHEDDYKLRRFQELLGGESVNEAIMKQLIAADN